MTGRALIAALGVLWPVAARASIQRVDSEIPWNNPRGYTPIRVSVLGTGAEDVELVASCEGEGHQARTVVTTRPSKAVTTTLLLPPFPRGGYCYPVLAYRSAGGGKGTASPGPGSDARIVRVDPEGAFTEVYAYSRGQLLVRPEALPDRWQAYPQGGGVMLAAEGERQLAPAQRDAILRWARAGGWLTVETAAQEQAWRSQGVFAVSTEERGSENPDDADPAYYPQVEPVPGTREVPAGGFMALALGFALLVGPLNLWWALKKKKARHILLVTTPLASLLTCILLVGYNLVSEGIDTKRQVTELTWLDQTRHEAVGWHGVTYFAAFPPGAIEVPSEALVLPVNPQDYLDEYAWQGEGQRDPDKTVDWTAEGQKLGAWIPARRNYRLAYVTPRPERRRLDLEVAPGGELKVTNGLGVRVVWLEAQISAGVTVVVEGLDPGRSAVFKPNTAELPTGPAEISTLGPAARDVWRQVRRQPGHFAAVLASPLEAAPGPPGTEREPAQAYLAGRLPEAVMTAVGAVP